MVPNNTLEGGKHRGWCWEPSPTRTPTTPPSSSPATQPRPIHADPTHTTLAGVGDLVFHRKEHPPDTPGFVPLFSTFT